MVIGGTSGPWVAKGIPPPRRIHNGTPRRGAGGLFCSHEPAHCMQASGFTTTSTASRTVRRDLVSAEDRCQKTETMTKQADDNCSHVIARPNRDMHTCVPKRPDHTHPGLCTIPFAPSTTLLKGGRRSKPHEWAETAFAKQDDVSCHGFSRAGRAQRSL
jgi:hypothetical protein